MRPTRRAAAVAAAAVSRPLSPSPISSEEDEMDSSELEEMDTGENEVFSEEDENEDEEEDQPIIHDVIDNNNGMESLSEQEEDDDEQEIEQEEDDEQEIEQEEEDDEQEIEQEEEDDVNDEEEEDEEEDMTPIKPVARSSQQSNKRKKAVIEQESEEDFSDDAEIVRNRPMTKRQRAKVYQEIPEEFLELPMDTGKKKLLTEEEEQLKKSEVARRRKNQSIQRAERDKADTINRLLKKQASKSKRIIDDTDDKETAHEKLLRSEDPNRIRYINTLKGSQLCIPTVFTMEQIFGETINKSSTPPKLKKCEVSGCSNNRKYTAKKTGKSVCSLEHYKLIEAI